MDRSPILGTRGSPLALSQAHKVASALEVANRWPADFIQIQTVVTSGETRPNARDGRSRRATSRANIVTCQ